MGEPKPFQFHPILHHLLLLLLLLSLHHRVTEAEAEAESPIQPVHSSHRNSWGWDPSMTIIIGALVGSFLFVALLSSLIRRFAESYFPQQGNTEWPCSCSLGGIDPETLKTFPNVVYSTIEELRIRKTGAEEDPLECAVCLTEFTGDDTLRLLPHCNHVFHPPCIDAWLSSHVTCPVCRADLTQDPGQVAVWIATTELGGGENDAAEDYGNRAAEQRGEFSGGGSENEGSEVAREGERNSEEDKGARERESKWKLVGKGRVLARSNTTGHSLVEAGECVERFTLRLPEDVRKYIMLNHGVSLKRSASFNVVESSRRGLCWSDSEGGSSRGKKNINSNRGKGRL